MVKKLKKSFGIKNGSMRKAVSKKFILLLSILIAGMMIVGYYSQAASGKKIQVTVLYTGYPNNTAYYNDSNNFYSAFKIAPVYRKRLSQLQFMPIRLRAKEKINCEGANEWGVYRCSAKEIREAVLKRKKPSEYIVVLAYEPGYKEGSFQADYATVYRGSNIAVIRTGGKPKDIIMYALIIHEFNHIFAKLADEYVYPQNILTSIKGYFQFLNGKDAGYVINMQDKDWGGWLALNGCYVVKPSPNDYIGAKDIQKGCTHPNKYRTSDSSIMNNTYSGGGDNNIAWFENSLGTKRINEVFNKKAGPSPDKRSPKFRQAYITTSSIDKNKIRIIVNPDEQGFVQIWANNKLYKTVYPQYTKLYNSYTYRSIDIDRSDLKDAKSIVLKAYDDSMNSASKLLKLP